MSLAMSKLLKYLIFFASGLIVFAVIVIFVLFAVVDPNRYRPALEAVVAQQTGLTLRIAGDMDWTFRPSFGLSIRDVRLTNGITPQELASFSNVALKLDPAALMRGRLDMQEFVSDNLHINWIVDRDGQSNWLLDSPPRESTTNSSGDLPININIRQITVNNASIDIRDQQQGRNTSLQNVNMISSNTNLNGRSFPLEISMRLIDGSTNRDLDLNLQASTSIDFNAGDISLDDLQFNLSPLVMRGSATINDFQNQMRWQADLSSNTFNLSYLLENFVSMNESAMPAPDAQQVTIQALRINGDSRGITLDELLVGLDDSLVELRGDALYATETRNMLIGYELRGSEINLDNWLPVSGPTAELANSEATDTEAAIAEPTAPTELPLELLSTLDIRGDHAIEAISYAGVRLAPLQFSLTVQNGMLNLDTQPAGFYDGTLEALLTIDANVNPAQFSLQTGMENVSATALTADKPRMGFFTGRFDASTSHTMTGNTIDALRDSIDGASRAQISDGSVDITMIKRVFAAISVLNPRGDLTAQWPDIVRFNDTEAFLLFNNGIRENQELSIRLDNFDIAGTGGVDLDNGLFDYQVNFTILGEPAPQTIRVNADYQNIGWPIRCEAAFTDPGLQYCNPDLQRVRDVFAQIARNEIERRAGDAIGEQVDRLRDRVRNLFQN